MLSRIPFRKLSLAVPAAALLFVSACSTSKSQNPVASNEEVGKVGDSSFASADEKPSTYTARQGDTLRKIAARPEIYGDPNLWPLLQEANADLIGQSTSVNKGVTLNIPREVSKEQREMAREKARQVAASSKMSMPDHSRPAAQVKPSGNGAKSTAKAAESHAAAPQPVPVAKKSGMLLPVLLILLLILAALAAILFYFMRKDNKETPQD